MSVYWFVTVYNEMWRNVYCFCLTWWFNIYIVFFPVFLCRRSSYIYGTRGNMFSGCPSVCACVSTCVSARAQASANRLVSTCCSVLSFQLLSCFPWLNQNCEIKRAALSIICVRTRNIIRDDFEWFILVKERTVQIYTMAAFEYLECLAIL